MARIVAGDRAAKNGRLGVGCSASVFDQHGDKMLLIRRADNGKWAVPGGYMEPGETFAEACKREVLEETGLEVEVSGLIGIYTSPHLLYEYPDGNSWQLVIMHFNARIDRGELRAGEESSEARFFSAPEILDLEVDALDRKRVKDGFARRSVAIVCDDFAQDL